MLNVTGERPKSRNIFTVTNVMSIVTQELMTDHTSALNQRHLSGKKGGSLILGSNNGQELIYFSSGENPESAWMPMGIGGGGGGGGITQMRANEAERAITFIDENGRPGKLMYSDLKATPLEFYLDVASTNTATSAKMNIVQGVETVVPIGAVSMTGRHHFITLDRANHRIIMPDGGARGTFKCGIAFRFSPNAQSDMDMDIMWYYRKHGSNDAWFQAAKGNQKRTASQGTAAFNISLSSPYLDLPDYPLEVELRIKFNNVGTVDWNSIPILNTKDDYVKVSLYKNPNYAYST